MAKKQFVGIDRALKDGLVVRAFRSGGGLRVVRIEEANKPESKKSLKACGSHPHLREALMFASADYLAGGGTSETHYLTGTTRAEDGLDKWVLCGHEIRAQRTNGVVKLEALGKAVGYPEKTIVATEFKTFAKAYDSLCAMISEEHLRQVEIYT